MVLFERVFAILLLLYSMQVEIGLTRPYEAETDPGVVAAEVHVFDTAIEVGMDVCGALLVLLRWRRVLQAVRAVWPLAGLALLAALSTAWSDQPMLTLRRSVLLLASTLLAVYLGERYTIQDMAHLLTQTLCIMISAIAALYFIAPAYVIDYVSHPGAWKGLSAYKNAFGQYMGTAVILLLLVRFRQFRWLRYVFLVMAAALLWLSKSAASLFCCLMIIAVMPLWRSSRLVGKQRAPVYTAVATALFAAMYLLTTRSWLVLNLLGRDATLSGRTQLWGMAWAAIMRHPILGYGFDSFWASLKGEALDVRIGVGWSAQRSDNGFLDLGLSLGMLGAAAFLFVVVVYFRRAIDYLGSESGPLGLWPITYLGFFLLHSMAESTLLTRGTFPFLLFAAMATSLVLDGRRTSLNHVSSYRSGGYELAPRTL